MSKLPEQHLWVVSESNMVYWKYAFLNRIISSIYFSNSSNKNYDQYIRKMNLFKIWIRLKKCIMLI